MEKCLKGFFWVRFSGQSMLQFSKGGLTQNDLYEFYSVYDDFDSFIISSYKSEEIELIF